MLMFQVVNGASESNQKMNFENCTSLHMRLLSYHLEYCEGYPIFSESTINLIALFQQIVISVQFVRRPIL